MSDTKNKNDSSLLETIVLQSWWVVLLLLIAYVIFDYAVEKMETDHQILFEKKQQLSLEQKQDLKKQRNLEFQIASQSDPYWIELTLMKELGVVPQNQKKVYFKQKMSN